MQSNSTRTKSKSKNIKSTFNTNLLLVVQGVNHAHEFLKVRDNELASEGLVDYFIMLSKAIDVHLVQRSALTLNFLIEKIKIEIDIDIEIEIESKFTKNPKKRTKLFCCERRTDRDEGVEPLVVFLQSVLFEDRQKVAAVQLGVRAGSLGDQLIKHVVLVLLVRLLFFGLLLQHHLVQSQLVQSAPGRCKWREP